MHYIGFKYIIQTQTYMSGQMRGALKSGVSRLTRVSLTWAFCRVLLLFIISLRQHWSLNKKKVFLYYYYLSSTCLFHKLKQNKIKKKEKIHTLKNKTKTKTMTQIWHKSKQVTFFLFVWIFFFVHARRLHISQNR